MEQVNYLSEKELSKKWNVSHRTLQRWRWLNMGPAYFKFGNRIRYSLEAIAVFEKESVRSTQQQQMPDLNQKELF